MSDTTKRLESDIRDLQNKIDSILVVEPPEYDESDIRQIYIDDLLEKEKTKEADEIANLPLGVPMSKQVKINGDEEPKLFDINTIITKASLDMFSIDTKLINATAKYTGLIRSTMERMLFAEKRILTEKQRLEDINMICSSYKEFSNVKTLTEDDFSGDCEYDKNTRTAFASSTNHQEVPLEVVSITGNGYNGNKYVYKDGEFVEDKLSTALIDNIVDGSMLTSFEYSRVCGTEKYNSDVNLDNKSAICTIELTSGNTPVNTVRINSTDTKIIVRSILVSADNGKTYHATPFKRRALGGNIYDDFTYINESNIIAFPKTNYFKIVFESDNTFANEELAYQKTVIEEDNVDIQVTKMVNAQRKVITIDNIAAFCGTYQKATLQTYQLVPLNTEIGSIAVFSNEYIPEYLGEKNLIKYTFIINGEEYEVVPINSNKSGTKMICYREFSYMEPSVKMLAESIKSAYLRVDIDVTDQNCTPFVNNLKVCIGA